MNLSSSFPNEKRPLGVRDKNEQPAIWGAKKLPCGVIYRVPHCADEPLIVQVSDGRKSRALKMTLDENAYWSVLDPEGKAGDRYLLRLPSGESFPDPASRSQPDGVHAASEVVDGDTFPWTDETWHRPSFRDLVIYELHLGTFTGAGTYRAATEKLTYLKSLHINAIEIMPISAFPGQRNWGYDGVYPFAPARAYGTPDDLRALIDAAHATGIAVILDVVYNHSGPDGNYMGKIYPKFVSAKHHTPWGDGINYDDDGSEPVRRFVLENVAYWLDEFHIDGLRLDATHTIMDDSPRHILVEIAEAIHQRGGYAIAEEPRNLACFMEPPSMGGHGFDAVWTDEYHHVVRVSQTRESASYFRDFHGSLGELQETLEHGWLYRGRYSPHIKKTRGTECSHLPPSAFIHFISTHDHAGNHALGQRINHYITPQAYRALSMLTCLSPYTPMLFMGQEWAASSPFLFFTDHEPELGKLVTKGRQQEFAGFPGFEDPAALEKIPDPQLTSTFLASKLPWEEISFEQHQATLDLYRACLKLRQEYPQFRPASREGWEVQKMKMNCLGIRFHRDFLLVVNLGQSSGGLLNGEAIADLPDGGYWKLHLSSDEMRFGGRGDEFNMRTQSLRFDEMPAAVLLAAAWPDSPAISD